MATNHFISSRPLSPTCGIPIIQRRMPLRRMIRIDRLMSSRSASSGSSSPCGIVRRRIGRLRSFDLTVDSIHSIRKRTDLCRKTSEPGSTKPRNFPQFFAIETIGGTAEHPTQIKRAEPVDLLYDVVRV
jgi:hypothetical protein